MKLIHLLSGSFLIAGLFLTACSNPAQKTGDKQNDSTDTAAAAPKFKEENVTYSGDSVSMNGFLVYDEASDKKRPGILVVPEWWGLNDYSKMRARELAKLGYAAMAIDMYGNGLVAESPDSAGKYATPFYQNPAKAKARIDAAMEKLKTVAVVDTGNMAAIGYCFGGGILLNTVRLGDDDLKGVVSFHGSLLGTPAKKGVIKSQILVCHGNADKFVPAAEVVQFKKQMDSIGAAYTFKAYENATHAFTNPGATEKGKKYNMPIEYNAAADTASWNDMKQFFSTLFQ
jgi:dienelactone hydrolase